MLILFNLHIFAAVIVLYSDFCEFSLLYRGDLLYRGTLPQHLIQKLLIGRILLSVPDILHINPGSLYIGMSERLRYDRHVHRGHESQRSPGVARHVRRERLVYPRQLSQSFQRLVIIGELAFVLPVRRIFCLLYTSDAADD